MRQKNRWIRLGGILCAALIFAAGCGNTTADSGSRTDSHETESQVSNAAGGTEEYDSAQQEEEGAKMPSFTAKDLEGNTVTENIFGDKDLTVLNIWGTFCNPCIREMPELGAWAKEMPDNVQMVGLIIDIAGDDDTEHHDLAVEITQNAGADFMQIIANADFTDILKDVYGVPTTLFVDRDGNIVGDPIIGADVDGYKKFVEEYLDGQ